MEQDTEGPLGVGFADRQLPAEPQPGPPVNTREVAVVREQVNPTAQLAGKGLCVPQSDHALGRPTNAGEHDLAP